MTDESTRENDTPPVTRDEILALFEGPDEDRAWSRQQIAERVWRNRGGQGVWDGPPRLRSDEVPLVLPRHVSALLTELSADGILTSAVGGQAVAIGRAYDGPRNGVRYYALADMAQVLRAKKATKEQAQRRAKNAAALLRAKVREKVTSVGAHNGLIIVALTVEQVHDILATLPAGLDEPDAVTPEAPVRSVEPPTFSQ